MEIARGAEAVLELEKGRVVKRRISKGYRLACIDDRLRRLRTRNEERMLERARRAGVRTPRVYGGTDDTLVMEHLKGERVKDVLNSSPGREKIAGMIGQAAGRLHAAGIVHGDLTTSNMILSRGSMYLIDFGLSKMSSRAEDQAVDLYLLYEALKAAHFSCLEAAWKSILNLYKHEYSNADSVLARLDRISKRRRYKGE